MDVWTVVAAALCAVFGLACLVVCCGHSAGPHYSAGDGNSHHNVDSRCYDDDCPGDDDDDGASVDHDHYFGVDYDDDGWPSPDDHDDQSARVVNLDDRRPAAGRRSGVAG